MGLRLRFTVWTLSIVLLSLIATEPTTASVILYNNSDAAIGTDNFNVNGWTLNFGQSVTNSFMLPDGGTVTSINFDVLAYPEDGLTSVNWYIVADDGSGNPLAGTVLASSVANPDATFIETNMSDFLVFNESFATPNIVLLAGVTYWLQLDNAVTPEGDPIYWDQSDGPASVNYSSSAGYFPGPPDYPCAGACTGSESFQLLGEPALITPEPRSLVFLGVGLLLLAGLSSRTSTKARLYCDGAQRRLPLQ